MPYITFNFAKHAGCGAPHPAPSPALRDCNSRISRPIVQQPPSLEPHQPLDERRPLLVLPRLLVRLRWSQERRVVRARSLTGFLASNSA